MILSQQRMKIEPEPTTRNEVKETNCPYNDAEMTLISERCDGVTYNAMCHTDIKNTMKTSTHQTFVIQKTRI